MLTLPESYGDNRGKGYRGELEIEIRDRHGRVLDQIRENNIIKIYAKEILAHQIPYSKVWDPDADSGNGGWVSSGIDVDEEFAPKYILFGASFDEDGVALDSSDTRFYTPDPLTGLNIPRTLGPGAEFDGSLINPIPISEPTRALKRIERIYFEPSYQPAGTPLLQDDVRAINNVMVLETTLRADEYNGLGTSESDYFTITEAALVGGKALGSDVGACECLPDVLFREGHTDGTPLAALLAGTDVVNIDSSEAAYVDVIKEGDQVKIVGLTTDGEGSDTLDQVSQFYLVTEKDVGSLSLRLDRAPTDSEGSPLTGTVGIYREGLRIFSHRILSNPVKKASEIVLVVRWRIIWA